MDVFDLPLEVFRAGSKEAAAENHLKHQENAVLRELVHRFQTSARPEASQHLQGCSRRLLMMQHARIEIVATAKEEQRPLEIHRLNLINICLNSYYLHLSGALDNLAWAATYEWQLLPNISEADWEVRRFCSLTNAKFIMAVSDCDTALADFLTHQQRWIQDVRRFRDPAAHRIPLTMVRGIMFEEDVQRYLELWKAAGDAVRNDQWEEAEKLQGEAETLGKFVPLLEEPRAPNNGMYVVPTQMTADQQAFLNLAHTFVRHLTPGLNT